METQNILNSVSDFLACVRKQVKVIRICADSRKFQESDIFVAIKGERFDGHDFLEEACRRGATGLVVEDTSQISTDYKGKILQVSDSRLALAHLAHKSEDCPTDELFCVGITGTNGKTTIVYMLESILNYAKITTGVMGTLDHHIKSVNFGKIVEKTWSSKLTTSDSLTLHSRLAEFKKQGAKSVVMEVSSHALMQKRVEAVNFNVGVFTNLTQDHLDYHKNMQNYFSAKKLLFSYFLMSSNKKKKYAIIHRDDLYADEMINVVKSVKNVEIWSYGENHGKARDDFSYKISFQDFSKSQFQVKTPIGSVKISLPVIGSFNIQNAVAALAVAVAGGVGLEVCAEGLRQFQGVPGRLQAVPNSCDRSVFVDYAHTPDALEKVLSSFHQLRQSIGVEGCTITVVFGCGGERDKKKRPLMAKTSEKTADRVFLTSDNPRGEEPLEIMADVLVGFSQKYVKSCVVQEVSRKKAIYMALQESQKGDVIVIVGKGHEEEQVIGEEIRAFSDYFVAKECLHGMEINS